MDLVWYCTALLLMSPSFSHAMCITSCEGRATDDGMRYPDCVDCDFYIRCERSGMLRRRCPLTLTFNAEVGNCDYPANAKCGATSATTSSTTTSPTTSQTSISPTTSSTTTTISSTSSTTTSASISSTTTTSPTVTTSPITSSSTTTTTTTTSATTTTPAPECRNNCNGVQGLGIYQDCRFCRDFRTCFGSFEVFHTCTRGLAYSHRAGTCDHVDKVNCGSSSPILTSSLEEGIDQTTCVDDCRGRPSGNYQSCSTCHGFTTCSNGITYKMKCAVPALWYDSTVGACVAVSSTCFYAG